MFSVAHEAVIGTNSAFQSPEAGIIELLAGMLDSSGTRDFGLTALTWLHQQAGRLVISDIRDHLAKYCGGHLIDIVLHKTNPRSVKDGRAIHDALGLLTEAAISKKYMVSEVEPSMTALLTHPLQRDRANDVLDAFIVCTHAEYQPDPHHLRWDVLETFRALSHGSDYGPMLAAHAPSLDFLVGWLRHPDAAMRIIAMAILLQ